MTKKSKIIIIITSLVAVLAIAVAVVFAFIIKIPSSYRDYLNIAQEYLDRGDYDKAIEAFRKAIELDNDEEEAYLGLAAAYENLGLSALAKRSLINGVTITGSVRLADMILEKYGDDTYVKQLRDEAEEGTAETKSAAETENVAETESTAATASTAATESTETAATVAETTTESTEASSTTEPETTTQPVDPSEYVTDAYSVQLAGHSECEYHIPQINLPGNDAAAINQEIYDKYYGTIYETVQYGESAQYFSEIFMVSLSYDWYVNGDVLSLVVQSRWVDAGHDVDVYNLSISSLGRLDNRAVYQTAGFSVDEVQDTLRQLIEQDVRGNAPSAIDPESYVEESTSPSHLDSAKPYFNVNGQLCVWIEIAFPGGQNPWRWVEYIIS